MWARTIVWRYRCERARVAHGVAGDVAWGTAMCGAEPTWSAATPWLGGRTDDERSYVSKLRKCRRCLFVVAALEEGPSTVVPTREG